MSTIPPASSQEIRQAYVDAQDELAREVNQWQEIAQTYPREKREKCMTLVHKLAQDILNELGNRYIYCNSGTRLRAFAQFSIEQLNVTMKRAEVDGWSLKLDGTTEAIHALKPLTPLKIRDTLPEVSRSWASLSGEAPMHSHPAIERTHRQEATHPKEHTHEPSSLMHLSDLLETVHHAVGHHAGPVTNVIMFSTVKTVQIAAAYSDNARSDHPKSNVAIDLATELSVAGALAARIGGGPASLVLGGSHLAQTVRNNWPGPSIAEYGSQLESPDPEERRQAIAWHEARIAINVMALPADAVHVLSNTIKDIVSNDHPHDIFATDAMQALSDRARDILGHYTPPRTFMSDLASNYQDWASGESGTGKSINASAGTSEP